MWVNNMQEFKLMGSTYFFQSYSDFKSKDIDLWTICDSAENDITVIKEIAKNINAKKEYFLIKRKANAQEYINSALEASLPMAVGKFLIPEFCLDINFSIADLPQLKPLIDNLDAKHLYEKVIYEAYIKNNDFYLTQEQRDEAYLIYKQSRA